MSNPKRLLPFKGEEPLPKRMEDWQIAMDNALTDEELQAALEMKRKHFGKYFARFEWDESLHPRVPEGSPEGGQFAPAEGGGRGGSSKSDTEATSKLQTAGYSPQAHVSSGVIQTNNVEDAVRALYEGRKVNLTQPREVTVLIDRLKAVTTEMVARGETAKEFDLCNVTVSGTNLFCVESKGIPREKMPQVANTEKFIDGLKSIGVSVTPETEMASFLRSTQNQLKGSKVAAIYDLIKTGKMEGPAQRIFVSKEGYILDGHHRWAALIAKDAEDNHFGDTPIDVFRVDMPIIDLMEEAQKYSGEHKKFHAGKPCDCKRAD